MIIEKRKKIYWNTDPKQKGYPNCIYDDLIKFSNTLDFKNSPFNTPFTKILLVALNYGGNDENVITAINEICLCLDKQGFN